MTEMNKTENSGTRERDRKSQKFAPIKNIRRLG